MLVFIFYYNGGYIFYHTLLDLQIPQSITLILNSCEYYGKKIKTLFINNPQSFVFKKLLF